MRESHHLRPRGVPALLAVLALTACAGHRSPADASPPREYRGHFSMDANGSWFTPCGAAPSDSAWWVTATGAAVARLDSARRAGLLPPDRPGFVRWLAVLTRTGEIGPRGAGAPALLVREVLDVRPATDSDCAAPR